MDKAAIERSAWELQKQIWKDRENLFPMGAPKPIGMLEPEIAARVLRYSFHFSEGLGAWGQGRDRFEIAGMLDRQREVIAVSVKFQYEAMRFTGAHEIGHIVLKHPGREIHRDRPIFRMETGARDAIEQEADYFAACFLAPARLVSEEFAARFGTTSPLPLTDAVAFHLRGESAHALMRAGPGSYEFASSVATARSFSGRYFDSLAQVFGISVSAMAFRLRELHLVEE